MKQTREDDSLPYHVATDPTGNRRFVEKRQKSFLSPEEAYRAQQLAGLVETHGTIAREYLLSRASLTTSLVEKRAWWMIYALLRFVEGYGHFPRYPEQMSLFDSMFEDQNILLNLPKNEQNKVKTILSEKQLISSIEDLPKPREIDFQILRDAGDQVRLTMQRLLTQLTGEPQSKLKLRGGRKNE